MPVIKTRLPFLLKIMVLPLVACAVVGADSLLRSGGTTQEEDGLDETLSAHFVRLEEGNRFGGVITGINDADEKVGIGGLDVMLIQQSNKIHTAVTNPEGEFEIADIEPGTYSFCVAGQNGFLAHGVHFLPPTADGENTSKEFEFNTNWAPPNQITAAVVPPEFTALRQIMAQSLPGSVANFGVADDSIRINVEKSVVAGGFQVSLGENGSMKGRVAPVTSKFDEPIRITDMNVFLIDEDEIYSRATVETDGSFEFLDVEPGVYGFAAAGEDGFAAISFQAVVAAAEDTSAGMSDDSMFHLTSSESRNVRANSFSLQIALCPPEDSPFLLEQIDELVNDLPLDVLPNDLPVGQPPVGGFAPNTGVPIGTNSIGGGFGGGGIGGGFGNPIGAGGLLNRPLRWLGITGGILGIIALADDDSPSTTQPVSPSN